MQAFCLVIRVNFYFFFHLTLKFIFSKEYEEEISKVDFSSKPKIINQTILVENKNLDGIKIKDIPAIDDLAIVVTRVKKGEKIFLASPDTQINSGDMILAVGDERKVDEFSKIVGLKTDFDLKKEYAYLNFKHNKNNFFKADLSILNKRDFFYEYNNDIMFKSLPYLRSIAFYDIESKRSLYTLSFFSGYNINLNERDFLSFSITRRSYPINFKKNLYYNIDGSLNLFNNGDKNYERFYLSPYVMYRNSIDKYDLSFKLFADAIYYKEDLKTEQKRGYLVFNPDIQTFKTYLVNDNIIIRNTFKFSGIFPLKGYDDLHIINDNTDFFNNSKRAELTLQQDAMRQEDGTLLYNLKISQGYYFDNLYQSENLSDTSFLFRTISTKNSLGIIGDYNHNKGEFTKLSVYNEYKIDNFSFNFNYNKFNNVSEFLSLAFYNKFTDTINSGVIGRYDIKEKILKETGLIFDYLKNCYSIKIDLRNKKEPSEFVFFVYINLYGLGEIKFE